MGPSNRKPCRGHANLAIAILLLLAALCLALAGAQQSHSATKGGPAAPPGKQSRPHRPAPSTYAPIVQQEQQQQQQQVRKPAPGTKSKPAISQQRADAASADYNDDPLADSEPAMYGSVAGAPGVDFPAYTSIPKTSFTCDGKGHDFGFYADPEAQCQVYHVCWSGRHEAFLCGVGTVFNQAILACDYWHSVDCSKSSQFYGVNSELGKAGAEPASQPQQRTQKQSSSSSSALGGSQFGEPLPKQSPHQSAAKHQRAPPSKLHQPPVVQLSENPLADSYDHQRPIKQQTSSSEPSANKGPSRPQALAQVQIQVRDSAAPPPPPPVSATKRARFNPDFNQKVNSLIEAPVRAPLKSTGTSQRPTSSSSTTAASSKRSPQSANQSPWAARKPARPVAPVQQVPQISQQPQVQQVTEASQQQQQRNYEPELDEPQQQQQQQSFDDSPVQTSTAQNAYLAPANKPAKQQLEQSQQQLYSNDAASSAITSQFDTLAGDAYADSAPDAAADEASNDDFRSAGAKAAASHNQNWYIMRTV